MNVLIVNDNLMGESNAVGYSMKNMLLDMPDVTFLQYCVDYIPWHVKLTDVILCRKTDSLSFLLKAGMESLKKLPQKLKGSLKKKQQPAPAASAPTAPAKRVAVIRPSVLPTGAGHSNMGELLRGLFYLLPCHVSRENLRTIRAFAPDVIYTLAENIRVINHAIKLSKKLGIPIVYHGMDDWKETAYSGAWYLAPIRKILFARFHRMHRFSVENIAICEKMADYYSETYGVPYTYACNCITEYSDTPYQPAADRPMKLVFSGSLHLHRGEVLQEVAEVIEELNADGYSIEMEVLAPLGHLANYAAALHRYPHTKWTGYGYPQKNKMQKLGSADILLHAEASGAQDVQYARYSFSTKLPEYFAMGRCVLAYGPTELASIRYVQTQNCGYVAEDRQSLKNDLIRLYQNPAERTAFARTAAELGRTRFSREAIQKTIYDTLAKNAKNYGVKS